jgi:hypothetical protein
MIDCLYGRSLCEVFSIYLPPLCHIQNCPRWYNSANVFDLSPSSCSRCFRSPGRSNSTRLTRLLARCQPSSSPLYIPPLSTRFSENFTKRYFSLPQHRRALSGRRPSRHSCQRRSSNQQLIPGIHHTCLLTTLPKKQQQLSRRSKHNIRKSQFPERFCFHHLDRLLERSRLAALFTRHC